MKKYYLFFALSAGVFCSCDVVAQSYVPEYDERAFAIHPMAAPAAYPFNLKDVRLLDGPFKEAMDADARYLLQVEPDRLLSDFRLHSGLEAKGKKYGGWESSGLAGHTLGHYLSACAMQYAGTGDERFLQRVNYIVDELVACQAARASAGKNGRPAGGITSHRGSADSSSLIASENAVSMGSVGRGVAGAKYPMMDMSGYVGAIPREDSMWSEVAAGQIRSRGFDLNGGWSPWYTVHKVMSGLLDAYIYCGNAGALRVEQGMADWTERAVGHLPDSLIQKMLFCEYGGMNEVLVNTYAITGNKKYLDLSYKFHDVRILDSLSRGLDDLPGKHSNTQIPKVIGCARRYELTGDEKDRTISEFFWTTVVNDHSYATGGNSNYEYLGAARKLNEFLTDNTTETCNTYNMLKLTRHLFAWHPSASYMDYYEKALYNHILASQNHEDGMMCYFVPLRMGTRKHYSDPFHTFTCCVGSGMENHVKYGESIYFRGKDGSLYVNLFIPSRLDWKEKGVTIEQRTSLPAKDMVNFTVSMKTASSSFVMRIRKPLWAGKNLRLTINGKLQQDVRVGADGYILISRKWKNGDRVGIQLPESFYTEAMPDNPGRVALFYGPVLLAGTFGNAEPDPAKGVPVLVTRDADPNQWIRQESNDLVFRTRGTGQPGDVRLIPFNRTRDEYYSVYWDLFTPASWAVQQDKYREDERKRKDLEDRTIDRLRLGEMQPERDHSFTGENMHTGEDHGQKWRSAERGGSFTFVMKVDAAADNALVCSYWGADNRGRIFEIQVDGVTIAKQDINSFKESRYYELKYPLPEDVVKGKQTVTVKIVAKSAGNGVGPIYGTIRMVRN